MALYGKDEFDLFADALPDLLDVAVVPSAPSPSAPSPLTAEAAAPVDLFFAHEAPSFMVALDEPWPRPDDDTAYFSDSSLNGASLTDHSTPSPASSSSSSASLKRPAAAGFTLALAAAPMDDDEPASATSSSASPPPVSKRARTLPKHPHAPTCQMTAELNRMLKLSLSEEELVELELEEIQAMSGVRLTKHEEREIRQLRRKLKNKMAASASREKKRNYLDGLEERVEATTRENAALRGTVDALRTENATLRAELERARAALAGVAAASNVKPVRATRIGLTKAQAVSCFMVVLVVFGAVANPRLLGGPSAWLFGGSGSGSSSGGAIDEARAVDAGGLLSSAGLGAAPAAGAQSGFTGRRLLMSEGASDAAGEGDDELRHFCTSFVFEDSEDELHHNNHDDDDDSSAWPATLRTLWQSLVKAVAARNESEAVPPVRLLATSDIAVEASAA